MFHVGQKVVCVNDDPSWKGMPTGLTKGVVYTIDALVEYPYEGIGVQLVEISLPDNEHHWPAFHPRRFRPVIERKTDISIFTRMLRPKTAATV